MERRPLGHTNRRVSALALGTVALGKAYGIRQPNEYGAPPPDEVRRLLVAAADAGITLFDTSPDYGDAEERLGEALGGRADCLFATKVAPPKDAQGVPLDGAALRDAIIGSLEASLRRLRRDVLDVVQLFKASQGEIERDSLGAALGEAQRRGLVHHLGCSIYSEAEALAAIRSGRFALVQIPYNLVDQRMAERVFPEAGRCGVALIGRSVFWKGALTEKAAHLPPELSSVRQAADRARQALDASWASLRETALRFCLASPHLASVLVGVRTLPELQAAIDGAARGPLPVDVMARAKHVAEQDERLLNPSYWPLS